MAYTPEQNRKYRMKPIIVGNNSVANRGNIDFNINTNNLPDPTAAIQIDDVNAGLLVSRMTEAQRNALPVSVTSKGLMVYVIDGTSPGMQIYSGTTWDTVGTGGGSAGPTQNVTATIAARDALVGSLSGDVAYVVDASADPTVTSGAALYVYDGTVWKKISEFESLDIPPVNPSTVNPIVSQWGPLIGTSLDYARADHRHPPQQPSSDTGNLIAIGADTWMYYGGMNRAHISDTLLVANGGTSTAPTIANITTIAATSLPSYANRIVYYTGTNLTTDAPTYVYHVDKGGAVTELVAPSSSTINGIDDVLAFNQVLTAGRILDAGIQSFTIKSTGATKNALAISSPSGNVTLGDTGITSSIIGSAITATSTSNIALTHGNTGDISITNSGAGSPKLRFATTAGNIGITVPTTGAVAYDITLPAVAPTAIGDVLTATDTLGAMAWLPAGTANNDVFITDTLMAPVNAGKPTPAEALTAAGAATDVIVHYNGTNTTSTTPTYVWHIDGAGNIVEIQKPSTDPAYEHLIPNAGAAWGIAATGFYTITIPQATHGITAPKTVQTWVSVGADYALNTADQTIVTATGDVLIKVSDVPDARFIGRVTIS